MKIAFPLCICYTNSVIAGGEIMISYAVRSHRGRIRETNEDSFFIPPQKGPLIFAVADGMGGHAAGEVASSLAVRVLGKKVEEISEDSHQLGQAQAEVFLRTTIQEANTEIVNAQQQQSELKGMGTTLTAAYIRGRDLLVAHVGDSQAHIFRNGHTFQLTEDHSLVMELLKNGEIDAEEVHNHPQRHMITRFLGIADPVVVDFYKSATEPGDYLLLCTDGLTTMLQPSEIGEILLKREENDLEKLADALLSRANEQGGSDNITFALINFI
jgi:PPM family protein phosphatase